MGVRAGATGSGRERGALVWAWVVVVLVGRLAGGALGGAFSRAKVLFAVLVPHCWRSGSSSRPQCPAGGWGVAFLSGFGGRPYKCRSGGLPVLCSAREGWKVLGCPGFSWGAGSGRPLRGPSPTRPVSLVSLVGGLVWCFWRLAGLGAEALELGLQLLVRDCAGLAGELVFEPEGAR